MQCKNCDWFDDDCVNNHGETFAKGWGRCRRHPPTCHAESDPDVNVFHTLWPSVNIDDWCGEFAQVTRDL